MTINSENLPVNRYEALWSRDHEDLWQLSLGIDMPPGVSFTRSSNGQPALSLTDNVAYPKIDDYNLNSAVYDLLLQPASKATPRVLSLPDNSTTLVNVLNEAAGTTDSFDVSPDDSRSLALLSTMFGVLARSLNKLQESEGVLPRQLVYQQVLVAKNTLTCKIIPPLSLEYSDVSARKNAWSAMTKGLLASLDAGVSTPSQRILVDQLRDPVTHAFNAKELKHEN